MVPFLHTKSINHKYLEQNDSTLTQVLHFFNPVLKLILNETTQNVVSPKRFKEVLL